VIEYDHIAKIKLVRLLFIIILKSVVLQLLFFIGEDILSVFPERFKIKNMSLRSNNNFTQLWPNNKDKRSISDSFSYSMKFNDLINKSAMRLKISPLFIILFDLNCLCLAP